MSLTIRSISGTLRNRHYPQIITRCSMSMENGCSPPDSILTAIPTRSLGSLNALKRSQTTRKPLRGVLMEEQRSRGKLRPGDFKAHITMLHDNRIEREAHAWWRK